MAWVQRSANSGALPVGAYRLAVWVAGFDPHESFVRISNETRVVRVGLNLGSIVPPSSGTLSGRVAGAGEGAWVQLVPFLGVLPWNRGVVVNASVREDGTFTVRATGNDQWILLVLAPSPGEAAPRLLHSEMISVFGDTEVEISLDR